jgi:hypothetical protein
MTRSEYGQVYDWIAAHPDGVKPGDVCRHVQAHFGKRITNPDGYLTNLEHHGFMLTEDDGRIFAWLEL